MTRPVPMRAARTAASASASARPVFRRAGRRAGSAAARGRSARRAGPTSCVEPALTAQPRDLRGDGSTSRGRHRHRRGCVEFGALYHVAAFTLDEFGSGLRRSFGTALSARAPPWRSAADDITNTLTTVAAVRIDSSPVSAVDAHSASPSSQLRPRGSSRRNIGYFPSKTAKCCHAKVGSFPPRPDRQQASLHGHLQGQRGEVSCSATATSSRHASAFPLPRQRAVQRISTPCPCCFSEGRVVMRACRLCPLLFA